MNISATGLVKTHFFLLLLLAQSTSFASMPTQVGGFELNTDITNYEPLVKSETTQPIRFNEALNEAETHSVPGFKSGYLAYGTCANPGKVVRIKLKYEDSSKPFYEKLLETYEDRFGKPKWLGDSFHVVSIWKWSFEEKGTQVDLYLQHNLGKKDQKLGNSVKMTMQNLVTEEHDCFEKKHPTFRQSHNLKTDGVSPEWEDLLPK
jgi:hypothetical protein